MTLMFGFSGTKKSNTHDTPATQLVTTIRLLGGSDAAEYQQLRLEALQCSPEAFMSTYEAESGWHESYFASQLDYAYHPPHLGYFGIFVPLHSHQKEDGQKLVGYIQVSKSFLEKQNHIVFLNNLYIQKDQRGRKYATALMEYVMKLVKQAEGVERVVLSYTAQNKKAAQFYQKLGFEQTGVRPKSSKWQGQYDDEIEMVKVV